MAAAGSSLLKPYIGIVHKDPESAYGISFPDAPGCFSAADELDDLFATAEDSIAAWIEGMLNERLPIPQTRDLSEIRADPEWVESLATSVFLIAVPRPRGVERQAA
jgi:predicted RNase H-like HicB family nuclease